MLHLSIKHRRLNPSFGDHQNNAFVLDIPAKQLFDHKGLIFKAKDWNRLSSDEDLGQVLVPAMDLYKASGEPMEYALVPPSDTADINSKAGTIMIRTLPATEAHLKKFGKKGLRGFVGKIHTQAKSQVQDIQHHAQDMSTKVMDHIPSPKIHFNNNNKKADDEIVVLAEEDEAIVDEPLKILVEVVAGRNLVIADKTSSDPYCKIYLGEKEIHKTKHLTQT